MYISGWGNYPKINADLIGHWSINQAENFVKSSNQIISCGLLRSYGDAALNSLMISSLQMNRILDFNVNGKTITCESGCSFKDLFNFLQKYKLALPVTPGTKFVTIGGAIASDIHGKNHHMNGSFGAWVQSIRLILADGSIINCSRTENSDLFRATIGGMGLTGFILDATIKLVDLKSTMINQISIQARDLEHLLQLFEKYQKSTYSVSWLDTNSSKFGRGVLFVGEESSENKPMVLKNPKINVPFYFPNFSLNKFSVSLLNNFYYSINKSSKKQVNYDKFFYPLDIINNWNRGYGKNGFIQYQFVVPKEFSHKVITQVLNTMKEYNLASFLTVLKLMGKANDYLLSFPMEGYTLAMDIPISKKALELANKLDNLVRNNGGRLYLTKDARMPKEMFWDTYPNISEFLEIKTKYDPNNKFQSLLSNRLGIKP